MASLKVASAFEAVGSFPDILRGPTDYVERPSPDPDREVAGRAHRMRPLDLINFACADPEGNAVAPGSIGNVSLIIGDGWKS
jgi:hypothetical protein